MRIPSIALWGDSIARGVYYDETRGRYSIVRDTFERAFKSRGVAITNHAKPGCTSQKGLMILKETEPAGTDVGVIEFGGNDSDLNWDEVAKNPDIPHEALVSVPDYEKNLSAMIGALKSANIRPVLVTPLPVSAEKYLAWISRGRDAKAILAYLGSAAHIYRWNERYAYAVYRVSKRENCPLIDIRTPFLTRRDFDDLMSLDGIHPNARGHAVIEQTALRALEERYPGMIPV